MFPRRDSQEGGRPSIWKEQSRLRVVMTGKDKRLRLWIEADRAALDTCSRGADTVVMLDEP